MKRPYNRQVPKDARQQVRCNLKRLRLKHGASQRMVAMAGGVTTLTVANYENGRTRPDSRVVAANIAAFLGVGVANVWPDALTYWPV